MSKATVSIDQFEYVAPTKDLVTPSGMKVKIREQNGNDEDTISNIADSRDGSALNKFMVQIVQDVDGKGKPSYDDVLNWKLKDKYYVLLNSRILSLGAELEFELTFEKEGANPITKLFTEDLNNYNWDFSKGFPPKKGEPKYNPHTIQPYENGRDTHVEYTLSSKKKIRFEYLTGVGEKYILELDQNSSSRNTSLLARNFQIEVGGKWQDLMNFHIFTSREMMEIRSVQERLDPEFDLYTSYRNPFSNQLEKISIYNISEFFFPKDYRTHSTNH